MSTSAPFKSPFVLSAVLPPDARIALARAAEEARSIKDDLARDAHVESAIARVKLQYPQFFKE
jgi:hypothetical protein